MNSQDLQGKAQKLTLRLAQLDKSKLSVEAQRLLLDFESLLNDYLNELNTQIVADQENTAMALSP